MLSVEIDELVKSQGMTLPVIPANPGSGSGTGAGIQGKQELLDPGFRRGDGFYDFLGDRQDDAREKRMNVKRRAWLL
jgi:hypothetical protein